MSDKGLGVDAWPLGELVQARLLAFIDLDQKHVTSVVEVDDIAQTLVDALSNTARWEESDAAARSQHCHAFTEDHPFCETSIRQLLYLELVAVLERFVLFDYAQPAFLLLPYEQREEGASLVE